MDWPPTQPLGMLRPSDRRPNCFFFLRVCLCCCLYAAHQFPKSVCTSVNEVICHGIPDTRRLEDGDIVNIDVSTFFHGCHGDLNETFLVGNVDPEGRNVVHTAYACLAAAIDMVRRFFFNAHAQHAPRTTAPFRGGLEKSPPLLSGHKSTHGSESHSPAPLDRLLHLSSSINESRQPQLPHRGRARAGVLKRRYKHV